MTCIFEAILNYNIWLGNVSAASRKAAFLIERLPLNTKLALFYGTCLKLMIDGGGETGSILSKLGKYNAVVVAVVATWYHCRVL